MWWQYEHKTWFIVDASDKDTTRVTGHHQPASTADKPPDLAWHTVRQTNL